MSQVKKMDGGWTVHESAYVDDGVEIGSGTAIWHFVHILSGTKIGEKCSLGQNVMAGPDVTIGNGCKIQNNVALYKGVILEDGVFCGPSMVFTNVTTPRSEVNRRDEYATTLVRKGATIGANATIVCGHELGEYCFIAAGAVVTKNVQPHAVMAGVPAKQIGWSSHAGEMLKPDERGRLICPRTNSEYTVVGGSLVLAAS
jgi:UDP-2-acetamido-3-amino-2,3-dideoxy-glucuronate N-acetyltransferase